MRSVKGFRLDANSVLQSRVHRSEAMAKAVRFLPQDFHNCGKHCGKRRPSPELLKFRLFFERFLRIASRNSRVSERSLAIRPPQLAALVVPFDRRKCPSPSCIELTSWKQQSGIKSWLESRPKLTDTAFTRGSGQPRCCQTAVARSPSGFPTHFSRIGSPSTTQWC